MKKNKKIGRVKKAKKPDKLLAYSFRLTLLAFSLLVVFMLPIFKTWYTLDNKQHRLNQSYLPSIFIIFQMQDALNKLEINLLSYQTNKNINLSDYKYQLDLLLQKLIKLNQTFSNSVSESALSRFKYQVNNMTSSLTLKKQTLTTEQFSVIILQTLNNAEQLRRLYESQVSKLSLDIKQQYDYLFWEIILFAILFFFIFKLINNRSSKAIKKRLTKQNQQHNDALEQEHLLFKLIFEASPNGLIIVNNEGEIINSNRAMEDLFKYSAQTLQGTNIESLIPQRLKTAHTKKTQQYFKEPAERDMAKESHIVAIDKNNKEFPVEIGLTPLKFGEQQAHHVLATIADITERKLREDAQIESQQLLRTIIDTTPMRIFWKDCNLYYLGCNKAFAEDVGMENPEALIGKNDYQLSSSEDAKLYHADDLEVIESGISKLSYDAPLIVKGGNMKWIRTSKVPLKNKQNKIIGLLGVYEDVTERKQAETKLEIAATIFESKEAMLITGADSIIINVNKAFTRLTGYSQTDIIGKHPSFLRSDRQNEAFYDNLRKDLADNDLWKGEIWNKRKNGEVYPEWETITAVKNKNGAVTHYAATMTDITQQKLAEEEMKKAKLNAIQANQAKSEFLSNMSHELRTPMNAILGFGQLLEMNHEENLTLEQIDFIQEILKAGNHLLELITEILDLSKIESGALTISMESIQLNELLKECLTLVMPLAEKRQISIFNSINTTMDYYLHADNLRLKQVMLNLLSNAVKYNRQQGNITLTVKETDDKRLRILVTDTGKGLSEEQQQKLFQPFERLDFESSGIEGTGIGLVISKRLIEVMGGKIGIISTLGLGSTFWIELELAKQPKVITKETSLMETFNATDVTNYTARILYIEDNPASLKVIKELIKKRPHIELMSAPSPSLGIELAQVHQLDLILLDINFPEMSGYELLRRLQSYKHLKHIPAVAISANATPSDVKKGLKAGFVNYLTKPINVVQFYSLIDGLLYKA